MPFAPTPDTTARWAVLIILLSFVVRFWFIVSGQLNLVQDEAQYWDWSRRLQLSYYSKGPLVAWLIHFWTWLFGGTELGVRCGALVNATLAQILLYWFLAKWWGRHRLALLALFVANTMPLFLASGILMTTDNILLLCWLGGLMGLYGYTSGKGGAWCLALLGLCMAVGMMGKYMMLAFFAVAALYLWMLGRHRLVSGTVAGQILLTMGLGAAIGLAPILLWNAHNEWVGFRHVGALAGVSGSGAARLIRLDTVPEFLGGQFGVAAPWWMTLMLLAGWRAFKTALRGQSGYDDPIRDKPFNEQIRQSALLVCGFWPLWLAMFVWSFHARIYANWPGMSHVTGIILAAAGLERLLAGFGSPRAGKVAILWPVLGVITFVFIFSSQFIRLPQGIDPTARLKGWQDMGDRLGSLAAELPNPDRVFYFSDRYDVTAETAFYGPNQPEAYCIYFNRRHNQYDLWPGPDDPASPGGDKTGWDAVYVTTGSEAPVEELQKMFAQVEIIPHLSSHNGKPARSFILARLRNYNGLWPRIDNERY